MVCWRFLFLVVSRGMAMMEKKVSGCSCEGGRNKPATIDQATSQDSKINAQDTEQKKSQQMGG